MFKLQFKIVMDFVQNNAKNIHNLLLTFNFGKLYFYPIYHLGKSATPLNSVL
jgi:hypothetical protein